MKYYIADITIRNEPFIYDTIDEVVKHLEGTVQRKFRLTKKQYLDNLFSLGYGLDNDEGALFVSSMAEHFNIGVKESNRYIRTNIHEANRNKKYMAEYGN